MGIFLLLYIIFGIVAAAALLFLKIIIWGVSKNDGLKEPTKEDMIFAEGLEGIWHATAYIFSFVYVILGSVFIAIFILSHQNVVIDVLSNPYFIPCIIIMCLAFFRVKCQHQVIHGMMEVFIGSLAISLAVIAPDAELGTRALAIFQGIFAFGQGLETMDKNGNLNMKSWWRKYFRGERGVLALLLPALFR